MADASIAITEWLTSTWRRVLSLPSVRIEDNFFDLGGTPLLAADLFRQIADAHGRVFPPAAIYEAPTIKSLTALLLNSKEAYTCAPLLLIRPGAEYPPVFLAPGIGGDIWQFFYIANDIELNYPLYVMQPLGCDGVNVPLACVEDMAAFYLRAIKQIQPNGPYFFIGYSLGGLVSLEIAQLLTNSKQEVGFLAMLDSYPHRRYLPPGQRVRLLAQLAARRMLSLRKPRRSEHDRTRKPALDRMRSIEPFLSVDQRIRASEYLALKRYRPRFYDGKITFVQARSASYFPDNPAAVWGALAREFELETVPGNHVEILSTHSDRVASLLSRHLTEAFRSAQCSGRPPLRSHLE